MKNKSLKEIVVPAVVLFLIGLICTALLAGTNLLTRDKIAATEKKNADEAKAAAYADAASFEDAEADGAVYYKALDKDGKLLGYVFEVTVKSYGGDLKCMVGVDAAEDRVVGLQITTIDDTPGLGMKAKTDAGFLPQYVGKTADVGVEKNKPYGEADGNNVSAITGATITSKAVTQAVNNAFALYTQVKDGDSNG